MSLVNFMKQASIYDSLRFDAFLRRPEAEDFIRQYRVFVGIDEYEGQFTDLPEQFNAFETKIEELEEKLKNSIAESSAEVLQLKEVKTQLEAALLENCKRMRKIEDDVNDAWHVARMRLPLKEVNKEPKKILTKKVAVKKAKKQ